MNIRKRITARRALALSVAASFAVGGALAIADEAERRSILKLEYDVYSITSPEAAELWPDSIEDAQRTVVAVPEVLVTSFEHEGERVRVTMLASPAICSPNRCPVRVFRGDEKVADFFACSNDDYHFVNASRSILFACDDTVETGLATKP